MKILVNIPDDLLGKVENRKYLHRWKSRNEAILKILKVGLEVLEKKEKQLEDITPEEIGRVIIEYLQKKATSA